MTTTTLISGHCHCGALNLTLETMRRPEELSVRSCSCSFCAMRRARWTSDPEGHFTLRAPSKDALIRYRHGSRTADFLMCAKCGVHVAAWMLLGTRAYATINFDVLQNFAWQSRMTDPTAVLRHIDGTDAASDSPTRACGAWNWEMRKAVATNRSGPSVQKNWTPAELELGMHGHGRGH